MGLVSPTSDEETTPKGNEGKYESSARNPRGWWNESQIEIVMWTGWGKLISQPTNLFLPIDGTETAWVTPQPPNPQQLCRDLTQSQYTGKASIESWSPTRTPLRTLRNKRVHLCGTTSTSDNAERGMICLHEIWGSLNVQ